MLRLLVSALICLMGAAHSLAYAESFEIQDIRIDGLQRVSAGTVLNTIPLRIGDEATPAQVATSIRNLFKTGNFENVELLRDGNQLIIAVSERPFISRIELDGNRAIPTEALMDGLKQAGLSEGQVFQRATLERLKLELERQYIAQGRYGAKVEPRITAQPRNRVAVDISIDEGDVVRIAHVNIVGNHVFPDAQLTDQLSLKSSHFWSFFKGDDKYSREKLSGDLETLQSYYQDRGYVNFRVESTQVSVTPDRSQVYIVINVSEGEKFAVNEVKLVGDLKVPEAELRRLILTKPGQTFSRRLVTTSNELISRRLGNEGYTFANVNGVPVLSENGDNTVDITFYVDAGTRVYVRRINFFGNMKTRDEVLRREMRQMEGAWAAGQKIENSKVRLERLGFFKGVTVETPRVPGEDDQIDINYTVEEQPSGSIGASVGYQQGTGFVFGANLSQTNFLGTGNRVSVAANRSDIRDSLSFTFVDPYFTIDGVSRGYSLFYQETNISDDINLGDWTSDRLGGRLTFGYPTSDISRLNFGVGFEDVTIYGRNSSPAEVWDLINYDLQDYQLNGRRTQSESFLNFPLSASWSISTLNRGIFATRGTSQSISAEVAVPGSELEYYKLQYQVQRYFPLTEQWTLRLRSDVAYGDGYGENTDLPFYENYYSGGFGSIRGYEDRSLGPRATQSADDYGDAPAIGGNLLVEGSAEFIFPMPFVKDSRSFRTMLFVDAGNVFNAGSGNGEFDESDLRLSTGVALSWLTGIGPLSFSLSKTLNDEPGDEIQAFQFSLGQPF